MTDRRNFIKKSGAFVAASLSPGALFSYENGLQNYEQHSGIKPKRLQKGSIIGLVTPGGPITKKQLDSTVEKLTSLGFQAYFTETVLDTYGYFAGTDEARAKDLMNMFANQNVDGILSVRGGYGAIRILDLLDYNLIQKNPKALIGYSDITALLIAIYQKTGLVTFHGPVGISTFNDFSLQSLEKVVFKPKKHYKYPYQREPETDDNPEFDFYTLIPGQARGKLIGGNLSVIDSMIGSAFEPDFDGKIVFLEEIHEKTYKIDKMLTHLVQATNIRKAAGIVLGIFNRCSSDEEPGFSLKETIANTLKVLNIPMAYGFPFGHVANKITLPTGTEASFDATKRTLQLLEKAVS